MKRNIFFILLVLFCAQGLTASYYFECEADVRLEAFEGEKATYSVEAVKDCGTHLQAGEKKTTNFKPNMASRIPPQKNKKYRVRYRYIAPECMQKDGKQVDCHREVIEIIR
ncbi:MAG: hypothetical protein U1F27_02995 [Turneriella sp.]